jgi:hypothetical protein
MEYRRYKVQSPILGCFESETGRGLEYIPEDSILEAIGSQELSKMTEVFCSGRCLTIFSEDLDKRATLLCQVAEASFRNSSNGHSSRLFSEMPIYGKAVPATAGTN